MSQRHMDDRAPQQADGEAIGRPRSTVERAREVSPLASAPQPPDCPGDGLRALASEVQSQSGELRYLAERLREGLLGGWDQNESEGATGRASQGLIEEVGSTLIVARLYGGDAIDHLRGVLGELGIEY